jgi:TolA-binding protein
MRYLKEVNLALRDNTTGKKTKNEEQISYQSGNETIIQPKYLKETSVFGTVVNMLIGLAIGVAITWFLVVPGMRRDIQNQAREDVLEANNTISSKSQTISDLEAQIEDLNAQITAAKSDGEEVENKLASYDKLLEAYKAYLEKDMDAASGALEKVNTDDLSTVAKSIFETITAGVDEESIAALYEEGYTAYTQNDFTTAVEDLQKVVDADESYDAGNALFYLAQAYRKGGDLDTALVLYQKFVEQYPGTERAATSQRYLNGETE